ncbi:MAG TPA: ABC transporter substrate-binding protein [Candidatus Limnocylindrales bacterium]|nr:ABC transporter substrate-binding protein [Candidatus Limnocylindrales bacterium]
MELNRLPSPNFLLTLCLLIVCCQFTPNPRAAELPVVRIAHGAFSEKIAALWLGAEQGLFRKHGVHVEVINIRNGPQTMAALVSGDIQVAYTIPGSVVSAAASGLDVAFFAGIVNRADGDFIANPTIRTPEDLKGKRIGVQSIGGGVWSMAMLAIEHLGWESGRDKMTIMIIGDSPVLAQSLESGGIEATYLNYTQSRSLKEKSFPVMLDLGKAPIPYQGLAAATRRVYLKQNPQIIDSLMRGFVEAVAFIHKPSNKEIVVKSLAKNLRLKNLQDAETGYQTLQWLYNLDIKPTLPGIQNMQRFLALTNPKVKTVKTEDVVDEAPWQRLEKSAFYRDLVAPKR